jgi:multisubunit Na+/H+ antiporter MnhB subunit
METLGWLLLDLLLGTGLLGLAWGALTSRDTQRAVVLFIAFGLLLALIWLRLRAPDIALAEAAIGAGLSGALLLSALPDAADSASAAGQRSPVAWLSSILTIAITLAIGLAYLYALADADPQRLAAAVFAELDHSGVSNPVTAVLLNFRAYDTLLELAVLLAAVLGILALGPTRTGYRSAGPVLAGLTRWLLPLLVMMSGYLLWVGAQAPGGAFQAGALLAAGGVLLRLSGHSAAGLPAGLLLRTLSVAGVALFLLIGLALMLTQGLFLDYPPDWAGGLILAIEGAATLAIAVTLVLAFLGGEPATWHSHSNASQTSASPAKEGRQQP